MDCITRIIHDNLLKNAEKAQKIAKRFNFLLYTIYFILKVIIILFNAKLSHRKLDNNCMV